MAIPSQLLIDTDPLRPDLATLRSQTAFVRSLVDELERMPSVLPPAEVVPQIVEELHRLARRCVDVAQTLSIAIIAWK